MGIINFISFSCDFLFDESVDVRMVLFSTFFIAQIVRTCFIMSAPKPFISNTVILPICLWIRIVIFYSSQV